MTKFHIITCDNKLEIYKKQINDLFGFQYSDKPDKIDYLFIFGGDGTFISYLKSYLNQEVKIIFINVRKLGFLSYCSNLSTLDLKQPFNHIPYLEIDFTHTKLVAINECIIQMPLLSNLNFYIDKIQLKEIMCSRIFLLNPIGSTGLARSYQYPIMSLTDNYLVHFLEEPFYKYYQPLMQPIILNKENISEIDFINPLNLEIKIDNQYFNMQTDKIVIKLNYSKAKVYMFKDILAFANNIKELL